MYMKHGSSWSICYHWQINEWKKSLILEKMSNDILNIDHSVSIQISYRKNWLYPALEYGGSLAFKARGHEFDPPQQTRKMLSLVSFTGMTLSKCAILRIRTLTRGPLCRESQCHPVCKSRNPTVAYFWLPYFKLSSCKTGVYNVRLLIILESGCSRIDKRKIFKLLTWSNKKRAKNKISL